MEGFRSGIPAFPAHAADYRHIHAVRGRIYVGGYGDIGQSFVDKGGYIDGRLCVDDRPYNSFPAAVPYPFPIPDTQHPAGLGRGIHRLRLRVHGLPIPAAGGAHVIHKRIFQDTQHVRLLEQPAVAHYTQP